MPAAAVAALRAASAMVPDLVRPHPLGRAVGELHAHVVEAEVPVDRQQELDDVHRLLGDLLLGDEDVRVVLREGAHAHQPVQRARGLVAVHLAELAEADRQVAVAAHALLEDLHVARAVHRLDGVDALIGRLRRETCSRRTSRDGRTAATGSTSMISGAFTSWNPARVLRSRM